MADYYLVHGNRNGAKTLLIPDKTKKLLKRSFSDISEIDIITLPRSKKQILEELSDYNKIDKDSSIYIASYPHKNGVNTYPVIFDDERFRYYTANLENFAEQRSKKVEAKKNGQDVKIGLDDDMYLDRYARSIIYDILSRTESDITSYDSLVCAKLKDIMKERYDYYPNMSTEKFINLRGYLIKKLLSGYKELRNLTYEYMLYLDGKNMQIRPEYNRRKYWPVSNMMPLEPVRINDPEPLTGEQMNLADFYSSIPRGDIPIQKIKKQK